jgi:hypothetical protein
MRLRVIFLCHPHGKMEYWNNGTMVKNRTTTVSGSRILESILTISPLKLLMGLDFFHREETKTQYSIIPIVSEAN